MLEIVLQNLTHLRMTVEFLINFIRLFLSPTISYETRGKEIRPNIITTGESHGTSIEPNVNNTCQARGL